MLDRFNPGARHAVVRAGVGALDDGRTRLDTDFLLLGLTEVPGSAPTLEHRGVGAAVVRAEIDRGAASAVARAGIDGGAAPRPNDRELLAALGIDLDEVRRRALRSAAVRPDDPALWQLRRSPVRPLR